MDQRGSIDGGSQDTKGAHDNEPDLPPQNLGVMFAAAAIALAMLLAVIGLIAYLALSLGEPPARNTTTRLAARVSGQL